MRRPRRGTLRTVSHDRVSIARRLRATRDVRVDREAALRARALPNGSGAGQAFEKRCEPFGELAFGIAPPRGARDLDEARVALDGQPGEARDDVVGGLAGGDRERTGELGLREARDERGDRAERRQELAPAPAAARERR